MAQGVAHRPHPLFGPDGKPVTLTAGQTFVQVVETGTKLTIKDGKVRAAPRDRPGSGSPASGSRGPDGL